MRILFWSANPKSQTGYGTAVRNLSNILRKEHEIAIHAFAGSGDHGEDLDGIPIFFNPQIGSPVVEWLAYWDKKFKSDIILSWFDLWLIPWLGDSLAGLANKFVGYVPIDSMPLSPYYKAVLPSLYKTIPMCYWGKQVIESAGIPCEEPIYHGVDTNTFYPMDKAACRKKLGIPEDAFVYLFIGTNFDLRKNIPNIMLAFKMFLDRVPRAKRDAYLILHTDPVGVDAGFNLVELWTSTLEEQSTNVIFTKVENYRTGTTDEAIVVRYNASDVAILCSLAEGFGFTPLEAAACGIPSILTDHGVLSEVWKSKAFFVDVADYFPTQRQLNWYAIPSTMSISAQIEYTYFHQKEVKKMSEKARKFALTLSWDNIGKIWLERMREVETAKKGSDTLKYFDLWK